MFILMYHQWDWIHQRTLLNGLLTNTVINNKPLIDLVTRYKGSCLSHKLHTQNKARRTQGDLEQGNIVTCTQVKLDFSLLCKSYSITCGPIRIQPQPKCNICASQTMCTMDVFQQGSQAMISYTGPLQLRLAIFPRWEECVTNNENFCVGGYTETGTNTHRVRNFILQLRILFP